LPSPEVSGPVRWLIRKEWRELLASRAWWAMLLATGPIIGVAFANAVRTYADISADTGCGIVCSPLLGIWAPTFGAFELVAIFLLPFVAIRSLAGDRQSGALALELQRPFPLAGRVAIKAAVIFAGWLCAFLAGAVAVALWLSYGGAVAWPELLVVALGHALVAGLTIVVALAIAAMTDHPSTAAIVALGITIGTWMIDFAAAVYGGVWERLAQYTPAAFVSAFQHGLVQVNALLVAALVAIATVEAATVWLRPGQRVRARLTRTLVIVAVAMAGALAASRVPGSWDASETRVNSFPEPVEEALETVPGTITVEVHLAPQDSRRGGFDRGPLAKLRRIRPDTTVTYVARTATGLYEQADPGYGEIRYSLGGRTIETRAVTDESVAESIVALAGVTIADEQETFYPGRPLAATPAYAPVLFFIAWPIGIGGLWLFTSRRHV